MTFARCTHGALLVEQCDDCGVVPMKNKASLSPTVVVEKDNPVESGVAETPWEDLRARALQDYEDKAAATHSWSSVIPQAINFYFDNFRRESVVDETQRRMDAVVDAAVEWHQSGREGGGSWFDKGEALGKAIDSLLELRTTPQPRVVYPAASFQPPDTCPECLAGVPFDEHGRHVVNPIIQDTASPKERNSTTVPDHDVVGSGLTESESDIQSVVAEIRERQRVRVQTRVECGAPDSVPFQHEADIDTLLSIIDSLKAERDLAVAHDRQPYPTAEAYEKVCAALNKHKDAASNMKAEIVKRVRQSGFVTLADELEAVQINDLEVR